MTTGTYETTDPNRRIKVERDHDFDDSNDYAPGVREDLLAAYEAGEAYGVIVEEREMWARITEDADGNLTVHDPEYRWKEVESIWSCVGYDNVAVEVAKEYFGLTVIEEN